MSGELGTIRETVMKRDGISSEEFDDLMAEAKERIEEEGVEMAEEILAEEFGLEPDYLFDKELGLF
jgi:hypothetical protein